MIVPRYWAEARAQSRSAEQQVTVRRFGWSDTSQAEAEAIAQRRSNEALRRVVAGETLPRREPKVPYNGASGVPIREEIIERHGDAIVTRNSYGARCLNVGDVFFGDVDFDTVAPTGVAGAVAALLFLAGLAVGWWARLWIGPAGPVVGLFGSAIAAWRLYRLSPRLQGGAERLARRRIAAFVAKNPDWSLRVYRTPAGLRLLALHRRFDPREAAVGHAFVALGVDPQYARMCAHQQCFRARLSAKPWRIGIAGHLRPRPGVWPVDPARLPERQRWLAEYDRQAAGFAACRFEQTLGAPVCDAGADEIRRLHDRLSGAEADRPLA